MSRFVYQLTFSAVCVSPTPNQIHAFVTQNRDIDTWYLPFAGTYLFKSDRLLAELQPPFGQFFGPTLHVLAYLAPSLVTGALPESIWDWLKQVNHPLIESSS